MQESQGAVEVQGAREWVDRGLESEGMIVGSEGNRGAVGGVPLPLVSQSSCSLWTTNYKQNRHTVGIPEEQTAKRYLTLMPFDNT